MRQNYKCLLLIISITLLGSCFFSGILSVLLFMAGITISPLHFPIAVLLSFFLSIWACQKQLGVYKNQTIIVSIVCLIVIFAAALLVASNYYDNSFDGMHYHLGSIVELLNGWNPIYEQLPMSWDHDLSNSFAGKGIWYCAAALAKMTGKLNSSKAYHTIMMAAAFCMALLTFYNNKNKTYKLFSILIAAAAALSPVYFYQVLSNYADAYLYNISICMICALLLVDRDPDKHFDRSAYITVIMSIALLCNIKFTGIFFAGMLYGVFYLKWCVESRKFSVFMQKALPGITGLTVALFLGINPYITNPLNGKNIFHPMLGANKIDLMGLNVPEAIRGKGTIYKALYTLFSDSQGDLKLPFTVPSGSVVNLGTDLRYESFGVYFSALLIFAILVFLFVKKGSIIAKQYAYLMGGILVLGAVFPESWWGRYFPFWWLLPLLAALILLEHTRAWVGLVSSVLTVVLLNGILLIPANMNNTIYTSNLLKTALRDNANRTVVLSVATDLEYFRKNSEYILSEYGITVAEIVPYWLETCDFRSDIFSFVAIQD